MFTNQSELVEEKVDINKIGIKEVAPDKPLTTNEIIDKIKDFDDQGQKKLSLTEAFSLLLKSLKNATKPYWARVLIKTYIREVLDRHPWISNSDRWMPSSSQWKSSSIHLSEWEDDTLNFTTPKTRYKARYFMRAHEWRNNELENLGNLDDLTDLDGLTDLTDLTDLTYLNPGMLKIQGFISVTQYFIPVIAREYSLDIQREIVSIFKNNLDKINEEKFSLGSDHILSIFNHELVSIPHLLMESIPHRLRDVQEKKLDIASITNAPVEEKKYELEPVVAKKQKRNDWPLTLNSVPPSLLAVQSGENVKLASCMLPTINRIADYIFNFYFLCKDVNFIIFEYYQKDFIDYFNEVASFSPLMDKNKFFSLLLEYPELIRYPLEREQETLEIAFHKLDKDQMDHILRLQEKSTLNFLLDTAISKCHPELIRLTLKHMHFAPLTDKHGIIINEPSIEDKRFIIEKLTLLKEAKIEIDRASSFSFDFLKDGIIKEDEAAYNRSFFYLANPHIISKLDDYSKRLFLSNNLMHMSCELIFKKELLDVLNAPKDYLYIMDNRVYSILEVMLQGIEKNYRNSIYLDIIYNVFDKVLSFYSPPLALNICSRFFSEAPILGYSVFGKAVLHHLSQTSLQHKEESFLERIKIETILAEKEEKRAEERRLIMKIERVAANRRHRRIQQPSENKKGLLEASINEEGQLEACRRSAVESAVKKYMESPRRGIETNTEEIKPFSEQERILFFGSHEEKMALLRPSQTSAISSYSQIQNKSSMQALEKKFNDSMRDYKGSVSRQEAIHRIRLNFEGIMDSSISCGEDGLNSMLMCLAGEHFIANAEHSDQFFKRKKESEFAKKIRLILQEYANQPSGAPWKNQEKWPGFI